MPFRYLLPMVDEMKKHRAQSMLREIGVARLSQADPNNSEVRTSIAALESQSGQGQGLLPISQSIDQVRSIFRGMEEV